MKQPMNQPPMQPPMQPPVKQAPIQPPTNMGQQGTVPQPTMGNLDDLEERMRKLREGL